MKPDIKTEGVGEANPLEKAIDQDRLPDFRYIPVTLTFDGYLPFKFEFHRQQSSEVKQAKQAFYALSDEEQEKTLKSYRVNILAGILTKRPENVQGFSENEDYVESFKTFFNDLDNEELLQWVWTEYQGKLYPKELLSSPLE